MITLLNLCFGKLTQLPQSRETNKLVLNAAEFFTLPSVCNNFLLKAEKILGGEEKEIQDHMPSIVLDEEKVVLIDILEGRRFPNLEKLFEQIQEVDSPSVAHNLFVIIDSLLSFDAETFLCFFYGSPKWAKILADKAGVAPFARTLEKLLNLSGDQRNDLCFKFLGYRLSTYIHLTSYFDKPMSPQVLAIFNIFLELARNSERIADGAYLVEQALFSKHQIQLIVSNGLKLKSASHLDLFANISQGIFDLKGGQKVHPIDSSPATDQGSRVSGSQVSMLKIVIQQEELLGVTTGFFSPSCGVEAQSAFGSLRYVDRDEEIKFDLPKSPEEEMKPWDFQKTAETSTDQILNFDLEVYDPSLQRAAEFMESISSQKNQLIETIKSHVSASTVADASGLSKSKANAFVISSIKALSALLKSCPPLITELVREKSFVQFPHLFTAFPANNLLHIALTDLIIPLLAYSCANCDRPSVEESLEDFLIDLRAVISCIQNSNEKSRFLFDGFVDKICGVIELNLKDMHLVFSSDTWTEIRNVWYLPRLKITENSCYEDLMSRTSIAASTLSETFKLDDSRIQAILAQNENDKEGNQEIEGELEVKESGQFDEFFDEESLAEDVVCESILKKLRESRNTLFSVEELDGDCTKRADCPSLCSMSFDKKNVSYDELIDQ